MTDEDAQRYEERMKKIRDNLESFTDEQSDAFNKAATHDKTVKLSFTLNEATTLLEVLKDAHAVAMMRAVDGYPKEILGTMVNAADDMLPRIAEATTEEFQSLHNRIDLTSPMKES